MGWHRQVQTHASSDLFVPYQPDHQVHFMSLTEVESIHEKSSKAKQPIMVIGTKLAPPTILEAKGQWAGLPVAHLPFLSAPGFWRHGAAHRDACAP